MIRWSEETLKAAKAGDSATMYEMAFQSGEKMSFQWAKKAYEACLEQKIDASNAAFLLGIKYRYGYGVKKDLKAGFSLLRQAAEAGNTEAMCNLGEMYRRGLGVKSDIQESLRWYEKAAAQNDWKALEALGNMYAKGIGVSQDGAKAVAWRERLACLGSADAMIQLAQMYEKGNGIEKDIDKAVSWYERAANEGSCEAMKTLGELYTNGKLIEADRKQAVAWYEKAAANGDTFVMIALGEMYEEDRDKALEWYRRAVKMNTRRIVWNAVNENIQGYSGENVKSETERNAQVNTAFQRCAGIIEKLNDALANLYEESLDKTDEETLQAYKETTWTGYEDAIRRRIDKLENDGDKKKADALRQRLHSAILGVFGIEVPKRKETLTQRAFSAILGALHREPKGWEKMYAPRNWMIRSCVREWMKMHPAA